MHVSVVLNNIFIRYNMGKITLFNETKRNKNETKMKQATTSGEWSNIVWLNETALGLSDIGSNSC